MQAYQSEAMFSACSGAGINIRSLAEGAQIAETRRCDTVSRVLPGGRGAAEGGKNGSLDLDLSAARVALWEASGGGPNDGAKFGTGCGPSPSTRGPTPTLASRGPTPLPHPARSLGSPSPGAARPGSSMGHTTGFSSRPGSSMGSTAPGASSRPGSSLGHTTLGTLPRPAGSMRHTASIAPSLPGTTRRSATDEDDGFGTLVASTPRASRSAIEHAAASRRAEAGHLDVASARAELVRRSFRHPKAQIGARLELLSSWTVQFNEMTRQVPRRGGGCGPAGYRAHAGEADSRSDVAQLTRHYEGAGLADVVPNAQGYLSGLDGISVNDGGCARTGELIHAFALLNFYRWLCGLQPLQIDSFRQQLADIVLQTLTRRLRTLQGDEAACIRRFNMSFTKFMNTERGNAHVILGMPGAVGAVRRLVIGPEGGIQRPQDPLKFHTGRGNPQVGAVSCRLFERIRAADSLWAYRALFDLAGSKSTSHSSSAIESAICGTSQGSINHGSVNDGNVNHGSFNDCRVMVGRRRDVACGSSTVGPTDVQRKLRGDVDRVAAFRRSVLDPRLRWIALVRRSCRVCIWTGPDDIPGEPKAVPSTTPRSNFLDAEPMEAGLASKVNNAVKSVRMSTVGVKFSKWKVAMDKHIQEQQKAQGFTLQSLSAKRQSVTAEKIVERATIRSNDSAAFNSNETLLSENVKGESHLEYLKRFAAYDRKDEEMPKTYNLWRLNNDFPRAKRFCATDKALTNLNNWRKRPFSFEIDNDSVSLMCASENPDAPISRVCFLARGQEHATIEELPPVAISPLSREAANQILHDISHYCSLEVRLPVVIYALAVCWRGSGSSDSQRVLIASDGIELLQTIRAEIRRLQRVVGEEHMPVAVCFPPPGFVPIELLGTLGAAEVWTISPDPRRFVPSAQCTVRVYRVRVETEAGRADRLPGSDVPLASFCVDCSSTGTPFCVMFSLASKVVAGDHFEVELSGLVCKLREPTEATVLSAAAAMPGDAPAASSVFRYFVAFEAFRPYIQDLSPLRKLAADASAMLDQEYLWADAQWYKPSLPTHSVILELKDDHRRMRRLANDAPAGPRSRVGEKATVKTGEQYTQEYPPPIGVVPHADPFSTHQWGPEVLPSESNKFVFALVVPRSVVVRMQMSYLLKSHVKWEPVPNATCLVYFEEGHTVSRKIDLHRSLEIRGSIGHGARRAPRRIIVQVFAPFPGAYELRLFWGLVPLNTMLFTGLVQPLATLEHPLRIKFKVQDTAATLVKSIDDVEMKHFGYPKRHPLADHFGVTLLGPKHYRLRQGYIRFTVYAKQPPILRESASPSASSRVRGAAVGNGSREPLGVQDDGSESSSSSDGGFVKKRSTIVSVTSRKSRNKPVGFLDSNTSAAPVEHASRSSMLVGELSDQDELETLHNDAYTTLHQQLCEGTEGHIIVAAVVGRWRRVEILSRRVLDAPPLPRAFEAEVQKEGSLVAPAVRAEVAEFMRTEVHEAVVNFSEEDDGQTVQIIVFQVGLAAHEGNDQTPVINTTPSSSPADTVEEWLEQEDIGSTRPPSRWCLAEFVVHGADPLPFDEDEMQKTAETVADEDERERNLIKILLEQEGRPASDTRQSKEISRDLFESHRQARRQFEEPEQAWPVLTAPGQSGRPPPRGGLQPAPPRLHAAPNVLGNRTPSDSTPVPPRSSLRSHKAPRGRIPGQPGAMRRKIVALAVSEEGFE